MNVLPKVLSQLGVWLNQLLAPADDPRQTFASTHQRQRDLLVKVQKALTDIAASKERLQSKMLTVKEKLPALEAQARQALWENQENLARLVLQRHQLASTELLLLEKQMREIQQEEQRLSLTEQRLSTQLETFFERQEIIASQYATAEAQVLVNEALTGISQALVDLGSALKLAEKKTETMQARATAIDGLIEDGILELPGIPGESHRPFPLDVAQAVEARLALLKREMNEGGEVTPD